MSAGTAPKLTPIQWLICIIAVIGFASGGRLAGTSFAWLTATLAVTSDRAYAPTKVALVAAGVGFSVLLIGFLLSYWLPEPGPESGKEEL